MKCASSTKERPASVPELVPVPEPVPGPGTIFGRLFFVPARLSLMGHGRPTISSFAPARTCARGPLPSCAPSHSRSFKRLDDDIHYAFTLFIPSDGSASLFAKLAILCNDNQFFHRNCSTPPLVARKSNSLPYLRTHRDVDHRSPPPKRNHTQHALHCWIHRGFRHCRRRCRDWRGG